MRWRMRRKSTPEKRQYTPDFYLPDYKIYLEHYGINRKGRAPQYTADAEKEYIEGIAWKRRTHSAYGTKCIETYSYEFKAGTIFENLKSRLEKNGVKFKPLNQTEINNALHKIYAGQEFASLFNLITTFIALYKRRLFYVALTRTKSIVYILSDKNKPSVFVKEIEHRCHVVNPELKQQKSDANLCPYCKSGQLIIRKSGISGERFYGCSNFPYCNYAINDTKAVQRNNRCPQCDDFLVIRFGKYGKFISCHGYPHCTYKENIRSR